jgi:AraC-like DNA-binding protein
MQNFLFLLIFVSFLNALVFASVLFYKSRNNSSLKILATFLIVYVGVNIPWFSKDIKYLPVTFAYAIVPLFFIYIKMVLGVLKRKDFLHLIPGVLEFLFTSIFFFNNHLGDLFYSKKNEFFALLFFSILPPLYNIFYAVYCLFTLRKAIQFIPSYFTEIEIKRLRWIKVTCMVFIVDYLLEVISAYGLYSTNLDIYLYVYQSVSSCFIIYWIAIYGLNQKNLHLENLNETDYSLIKSNDYTEEKALTTNEEIRNNSNSNTEVDEFVKEIELGKFKKIVTFFEETCVYRNKDVNLFMISDLLQMPYRDVSRLINTYAHKNFNQFVNEFRIKEAKKILVSTDYNKFNLEIIGEKVGFSSRTSFYTVFKSIAGKTPLEYKKEHQKLT